MKITKIKIYEFNRFFFLCNNAFMNNERDKYFWMQRFTFLISNIFFVILFPPSFSAEIFVVFLMRNIKRNFLLFGIRIAPPAPQSKFLARISPDIHLADIQHQISPMPFMQNIKFHWNHRKLGWLNAGRNMSDHVHCL